MEVVAGGSSSVGVAGLVWRGVAAGLPAGRRVGAVVVRVCAGGGVRVGWRVLAGTGSVVRPGVGRVLGCGVSVVGETRAAGAEAVGTEVVRSRTRADAGWAAAGGAVASLSGVSNGSRVGVLPGMPSRMAARTRCMRPARTVAIPKARARRVGRSWGDGSRGVTTVSGGSAPSAASGIFR